MLDINTLRQDFKGDLVTSDHPDYATAIARWAANAERRATVVAFVKDKADVIRAIKFARDSGLEIAVRGGGHSASGASSTEGGLVVDLSRYLNKVTVDAEKKLAYVGGGALWETVDREAMVHGLAAVAGTVNHTGVGGLTLGGGYGWLSGERGLVLDNLVQATVVTADGSILTASPDENGDLFFAIRGGGVNFGVVTEFVFRLAPQRPTVFAGQVVFPVSRMEDVVNRTNMWWKTGAHVKSGLLLGFMTDPEGNPIIWALIFYNGPESESRASFEWLLSMDPVINTTKEVIYEELNTSMNHLFPHGKGTWFHSMTFCHIHLPTIQLAHEKLVETATLGKLQELVILYQYFPRGVIDGVPRDATAFRRGTVSDTMDVLLSFRWDQSNGDQTHHARLLSREPEGILSAGEPGMNNYDKLGYSNHDAEASTTIAPGRIPVSKASLVFGDNYTRLQKTKKRYDADNVFHKWFPITPAS